jgi:glycosyltransferase involved in cell wall biosynthesis
VTVTKPLVSIVTPSLNQAAFIEEAIRSVLEQDYAPIEYVVVDGGSADGTQEILLRYPDIRWVSEPDGGQSAALNKGFRLVSGEILAWINADDFYLPGAVSSAVEALHGSDLGLVYGDILRVDEDGTNRRRVPSQPWDLWHHVNDRNRVWQAAAFFTRAAYEAVGGIDERYHLAMDYDLWLRIGRSFPVRRVDAVWAAERRHPSSKTSRHAADFWLEDRRISRAHGGRLLSPMLTRRIAGDGRAARLLNRTFAAAYMVKELRLRTLVARLRALPKGG